jgi:hypothetical protein
VRLKHLRKKDWQRLAALTAIVIAFLAVEMAFGGFREFYTQRPLQAGVLTGVLLATVAFFGFDAVRADLNERRWAPLSNLAMLSMAHQTTLLIDVALWLATGRPPVNEAAPSEPAQASLVQLRARVGLPTTDGDVGGVGHAQYSAELEALLGTPAFRAFAGQQWDRWKWNNRAGVAQWAAAMLTTGETADVLNRLALLNEGISHLQRRLTAAAAEGPAAAVDTWLTWHAEAVSLREDLVRVARGSLDPDWTKFRGALRDCDRAELAEQRGGAQAAQGRAVLSKPFRQVA